MPRKNADLRMFQLTQELDPRFWSWSEVEVPMLSSAEGVASVCFSRLTSAGVEVSDLYAIVHDHDGTVEAPVAPHVHLIARFPEGVAVPLPRLAEVLGVAPQYIEKAKRGRAAWDSFLSYLVHIKYVDKYQYDPLSVYTAKGPAYVDVFNDRKDSWLSGRATVAVAKAKAKVQDYKVAAVSGAVSYPSMIGSDEGLMVYSENAAFFDRAFAGYTSRLLPSLSRSLLNGDFSRVCLYVTGRPGFGKTYLCQRLAFDFQDYVMEKYNKNIQLFVAAEGPRSLDNYRGQEMLLFDDPRPSFFKPTSWLSYLDPCRFSPFSARFKNQVLRSLLTFISCFRDPFWFFSRLSTASDGPFDQMDDLHQYLRRIRYVLAVDVENGDRVFTLQEFSPTSEPYTYDLGSGSSVLADLSLRPVLSSVSYDTLKSYLFPVLFDSFGFYIKNYALS